jgi:ubiquitin fusion degradation protein 1
MLDVASSSTRVDAKPLELEFGQLFFGYPIVPYTPPATPPNADAASPSSGIGLSVLNSLRGEGNTLSGRPTPRSSTPVPAPATPEPTTSRPTGEHDWGTGGQALGSRKPAAASTSRADGEKKKRKKKEVIEID